MSLDLFIPFLIATAILLATPGPTILLVVSYALAQGRGVALAVVGGVILGDLLAMSAANQLVQGQSSHLAGNIPQRDINPRQGLHRHALLAMIT